MRGIKCNQMRFTSVILKSNILHYNNAYVYVKEMKIITATRVDPVTWAADHQAKHNFQKL